MALFKKNPASEESQAPQKKKENPKYVVKQEVLKEEALGTGSSAMSLMILEGTINLQADKGYRLHSFSTVSSGGKGIGGGDRIQVTMVFERIDGTETEL